MSGWLLKRSHELKENRELCTHVLLHWAYFVVIAALSPVVKSKMEPLQSYVSFDIHDESLNYIHQTSEVPGSFNYVLPSLYVIVIILFEMIVSHWANIENDQPFRDSLCKMVTMKMFLKFLLRASFLALAVAETALLNNVTKTLFGGLKPHFLKECKPDPVVVAELESNNTSWVNEVLTRTICTNHETDYRRSFPSGHASQAAVTMMFGCLELLSVPNPLARLIQLPLVIYTIYIWSMRVSDNHHFWYDVFGGAVLGFIVGISAYYSKYKVFKSLEAKETTTRSASKQQPGDHEMIHRSPRPTSSEGSDSNSQTNLRHSPPSLEITKDCEK